jgi:hypothetical protein
MLEVVEDLSGGVEVDADASVCSGSGGRSLSVFTASMGVGSNWRRENSVSCEAFERSDGVSMVAGGKQNRQGNAGLREA